MRSGSATEELRHVAIGYQLKRVCQKADREGGPDAQALLIQKMRVELLSWIDGRHECRPCLRAGF